MLNPDQILTAYKELFSSENGQIVLQDLIETFIDRENQSVEEELGDIPHPYREYVAKGQRDVILLIKKVVSEYEKLIRQIEEISEQSEQAKQEQADYE